jgi:hypothetical protein
MILDSLMMSMSRNYRNAYDRRFLCIETHKNLKCFQEITKLWRDDWFGNV